MSETLYRVIRALILAALGVQFIAWGPEFTYLCPAFLVLGLFYILGAAFSLCSALEAP